MRCLYCGKHLPLLRKLTGGGEFCTDAHRDKYHEEYNRLAVSRLLQAQARPEESKAGTNQEVDVPEAAPVASEEPDMSEIPGSFIEEFQFAQIHAVATPSFLEIEPEPVFLSSSEPSDRSMMLSIQPSPFTLRTEERYLAGRATPHRVATERGEIGAPFVYEVEQVLPRSSGAQFAAGQPALGAPMALDRRLTAHRFMVPPLESGVSALQFDGPKPAMPGIPSRAHAPGLPRAGSLRLVLTAIATLESPVLEIGLLESFPDLVNLRPALELRMKLLDDAPEALPAPLIEAAANGIVPNGTAEVVPITPRRVLEALSQLHAEKKQAHADNKPKEPQEPPQNRTIKAITIPAIAPVAEVLTGGFNSVLFTAKPHLLRHNTQPLRPKMAIGTAAGPLRVPSESVRIATGRQAHYDENGNGTSKISSRSMLHLEDETHSADLDNESPSLLGKLGGLFGKKARPGKLETGSRKSDVRSRNEAMRS